jgi:hypothetical protein
VRFFLWMHVIAAVIVPFFRDWGGLSFAAIRRRRARRRIRRGARGRASFRACRS